MPATYIMIYATLRILFWNILTILRTRTHNNIIMYNMKGPYKNQTITYFFNAKKKQV